MYLQSIFLKLLLLGGLSTNFAFSAQPHFFRFAEVKRFKEVEGLPPKIRVTFDLNCNEQFSKIIRHEFKDKKTDVTIIALGVLVEENLLSSCAGETKEVEFPAGNSYSGKQYSIALIKK